MITNNKELIHTRIQYLDLILEKCTLLKTNAPKDVIQVIDFINDDLYKLREMLLDELEIDMEKTT